MSHRIHTRLVALAAACLAVVLSAISSPAFAHDELIGASPAAGAQLEALPAQLELTFSGVLFTEEGATGVSVTDAAGTDLTSGDPVIDGTRLTQPLTGTAQGAVTVTWRVVSSDGHPISGQYSFTVENGAIAPTGVAPSTTEVAPVGDDYTAVWITLGAVIVVALIAVLTATVAANRKRREH